MFTLLATVAVYGMDQEAPTTSAYRAHSGRSVYHVDLSDPELYSFFEGGSAVHGYGRTSGSVEPQPAPVAQEPCAEPAPQPAPAVQEPAQEEQPKARTLFSLAKRGLYNLTMAVGKNIGGFIIENPKTAAVAALVGVLHFEPNSVAYLGHTAVTIMNNLPTQEAFYQFSVFLEIQYGIYFFDQNPWTRRVVQAGLLAALCYDPTAFAGAVWNSLCYI